MGGGFTVEQEMLTSLIQLIPQSRHQFTLFLDKHSKSDAIVEMLFGKIKIVFLEETIQILDEEKTQILQEEARILQEEAKRSEFILKRLIKKIGWNKKVYQEPPLPKAVYREVQHEVPLQEMLRRENIEFVWFPTPNYSSPIDVPYIATIFDIQHRFQPWFPEVGSLNEWDQRESYHSTHLRRAAFVVVGTHEGGKEVGFFYQIPPERFRVLPPPVPCIDHLPSRSEVMDVLAKYGISGNYLFYPAQFWTHKNHVNLLRALKSLRDKYGITMSLVFTGSDYGNCEYVKDMTDLLKLKDQVFFLGFVPRDDILALYSGAFALTYATYFGPDNIPPLEAFACGCPVILSDVLGSEEQFGDAVLRVDPSSPDDIALAVEKVYSNSSLRDELISKGLVRSKKYTGLDYVLEIFKIMDEFENVRINWR